MISPAIAGGDFASVEELDKRLLGLDETPRKEKIGGNLALGISVAFARALAASRGIELWEILQEEFFPVPGKTATGSVNRLKDFFVGLGNRLLASSGGQAIASGDEE